MYYLVRSTPVKDLKPGDWFRAANDHNFKIKDIDWTNKVVEIEYYTGTRDYFVSFFVSPERIIDNEGPIMKHTLITIRPTNGTDLAPRIEFVSMGPCTTLLTSKSTQERISGTNSPHEKGSPVSSRPLSTPKERSSMSSPISERRTNMPYYRKKPIAIEARQYNDDAICVYTLEGPMWFDEGDYIIKGVRGEFYPCQKDIFEETYEKVN